MSYVGTLVLLGLLILIHDQIFTDPAAMRGVIGIVVQGGQMAETGLLLDLAISLSLSLAVLNLLPVPVLDGGQILLGCLEEAFPRLVRLRPAATLLGVVLLGGLMVYANVQDLARYLG
jgi:regulator of sigma E protease